MLCATQNLYISDSKTLVLLLLIQFNLSMGNKKEVLHVKSNGLRNELKEIRKSIDTLTHALHIMIETQTNKRYEKDIIDHRSTADASDTGELHDCD